MKKTTYLSFLLVLVFGILTYAQPFNGSLFNDEETFNGEDVEYFTNQFDSGPFFDRPFLERQSGKGFNRDGLIKKLNLTAEQQKQINDIRSEHQKKMIDLKAQLQKNRIDIKNMMLQNKVDEKKLLDLTQANNKIQSEMRTSAVNNWLAIYKILNDEQKEIWAKHWGQGLGLEKRVILKQKLMDQKRMRMHR